MTDRFTLMYIMRVYAVASITNEPSVDDSHSVGLVE